LVERIDLSPTGIDIRLRVDGLTSLFNDLRAATASQQEAA